MAGVQTPEAPPVITIKPARIAPSNDHVRAMINLYNASAPIELDDDQVERVRDLTSGCVINMREYRKAAEQVYFQDHGYSPAEYQRFLRDHGGTPLTNDAVRIAIEQQRAGQPAKIYRLGSV